MVSWNLNTLRFGGDSTPQSSDKVIGSLVIVPRKGTAWFLVGVVLIGGRQRRAIKNTGAGHASLGATCVVGTHGGSWPFCGLVRRRARVHPS